MVCRYNAYVILRFLKYKLLKYKHTHIKLEVRELFMKEVHFTI